MLMRVLKYKDGDQIKTPITSIRNEEGILQDQVKDIYESDTSDIELKLGDELYCLLQALNDEIL